jgi:hypothetical protein
LTNSTLVAPACAAFRGELEHLVGHVQSDRLARLADALGGDQDVCSGAGPEVEDGLALVQVGDSGRDAAAERGADCGVGRALGVGAVVEGVAEDLVAGLVGQLHARAAAGRPCGFVGGKARGRGGVALSDLLADLCLRALVG